MSEIILYPTETIYALGVNPFDEEAWSALCELKSREETQSASWLVRNAADIETWGVVTPAARQLIQRYLPGPLTLVLTAKDTVPKHAQAKDGTVSFRISDDEVAALLIRDYMSKHEVPLTCTSANVHGMEPEASVRDILAQFGERAKMITKIVDDGPRNGEASTIVRCVGDATEVLRQGAIVL
ncbi:MAG TPA: L-threonylcarbamoyladenylate synthase [Candidatus Paceibacterota bacterium]